MKETREENKNQYIYVVIYCVFALNIASDLLYLSTFKSEIKDKIESLLCKQVQSIHCFLKSLAFDKYTTFIRQDVLFKTRGV
jgi:hypothetical protein